MASSSTDTLVELRKSVLAPPILKSEGREEIRLFLKEYDKYISLKATDSSQEKHKAQARTLRECVDENVKDKIEFINPESIKSDEALRKYLEERTTYQSVEEVLSALERVHIDRAERDVSERYNKPTREFVAILKKCNNTNKPREKVLIDKYVSMLWPLIVQKRMEAEASLESATLVSIMKKTEDIMREQEQYHKVEQSLIPKSQDKGKSRYTPHVESGHAKSEERNKDNVMTNPCRICHKVQWTPEHYEQCRKTKGSNTGKGYQSWNNKNTTNKSNWINPSVEKNSNNSAKIADASNIASSSISTDNSAAGRRRIMVNVGIGSEEIEAQIDTGATCSLISEGLVTYLSERIPLLTIPRKNNNPALSIIGFAGEKVECKRSVAFELEAPTRSSLTTRVAVKWAFVVIPKVEKHQLLLGMDLLEKQGIVDNDSMHLPLPPKKSEELVKAEADEVEDEQVMLAAEAAEDQTSVELRQARVEKDVVEPKTGNTATREIDKVKLPTTNPEFKKKVYATLAKYEQVFEAKLPAEAAHLRPFRIVLKNTHKVVYMSPRPLSPALRQQLKEALDTLKSGGIVRDSDSEFASAFVIIKDGDGNIKRICVDYRQLNDMTETFEFPIPDIKVLLQYAAGMRYFGHCDCRKGYHQNAMDPESIKYTAAVGPDEHIEYLRLPFGVKNGPPHFQMEMQKAFSDLLYNILVIFIDDLLVYGDTEDTFINNLDKVLHRCNDLNLRLKAEKCELGLEQVECVGYILSGQGRRMSQERVSPIQKLPRPRDIGQLREFLGKVNYFRDFIRHCSQLTAPLTSLLQKNKPFEWTSIEEDAFVALKMSLTAEETLAHGTEEGILILRTDASGIGIGGTLLLKDKDGKERPVCYFSATLTETQRRWSTIEQELYAIIYCMTRKSYATLLKWKPFVVETDHRNLVWLDKAAADNRKLTRWRMIMMEYNFTVRHIPGETNAMADLLSRWGHDLIQESVMAASVIPAESIHKRVVEIQEEAVKTTPTWPAQMHLTKTDDLYRNPEGRIVLPDTILATEFKKELLAGAHGTPFTGHLGRDRTVDVLKQAGYDWPRLHDDVRRYVLECLVCQKTRLRGHVQVELGTTAVNQPFYCMCMDSMGPLPITAAGFRYILVLIDAFTRWCEIIPLKTLTAHEAAEAIVRAVFLRHGLPAQVRSDNGTQFSNAVMDELLSILKVEHHYTTPYHPEANGIVERVNAEIITQLKLLLIPFFEEAKWDVLLPLVQHIINNSVNISIGTTPYCLLYGDQLQPSKNLPTVLLEGTVNSILEKYPDLASDNLKTYADELKQHLLQLQDRARKQQEDVVSQRLERHNKVEPKKYTAGEYVLLVPTEMLRSKLKPKYDGPFRVIKVISKFSYEVQSLVDPGRVLRIHPERMIPFMPGDRSIEELTDLAAYDAGETLVDRVVEHNPKENITKKNARFRVRWSGYDESGDTWEPLKNLSDANGTNEHLLEYINAHPELQHLL